MTTIPVLYSFARSGGTLVNQLLGVHPQCLVLSEVNPAGSCKAVAEQAVQWLQLAPREEESDLSRRPYHEQLAVLNERASGQGKRLVVRDWVTLNFLPGCAGARLAPSGILEQEIYLERAGMAAAPLVVTRRSSAVLASIREAIPHLQGIGLPTFAESYLAYARAVSAFPRVQLELLQKQPDAALARVLEVFGLDSSSRSSLLERFHEFRNCTGNTTLKVARKSATATSILPPEARPAAEAAPALDEADRLLGYE